MAGRALASKLSFDQKNPSLYGPREIEHADMYQILLPREPVSIHRYLYREAEQLSRIQLVNLSPVLWRHIHLIDGFYGIAYKPFTAA